MTGNYYYVLLWAICCLCSVSSLPHDGETHPWLKPGDDEINNFLQETDKRIRDVMDKAVELEDDIHNPEEASDKEILKEELNKMKETYKDIFEKVNKFNLDYVSDEDKKQALKEIGIVGGPIDLGADWLQLTENNQKISKLVKDSNLKLLPRNEVQCVIETFNNEKSKQNWQELYEKLNAILPEVFFKSVDLIQKHAAGFNKSPEKFWYTDYDDELVGEFDNVVEQVKPFYTKLHAYVREFLKKLYGTDAIPESGRIPEHLYKHVQLNAFNSDRLPEKEFLDEDTKKYADLFKKLKYSAEDIYLKARDYYESLGVNQIDDDLWKENVYEVAEDADAICPANLYSFGKNITLGYCDRTNFMAYYKAHIEVGKMQGEILRADLPTYFQDSFDLDTPASHAVKLAALTKTHLERLGMPANEVTNKLMLDTNFRVAMYCLFALMYSYVEVKVMLAVLGGKVERPKLNEYYWKLMAEHAGVERPVDRPQNSLDMPFAFFIDLNSNLDVMHKFAMHPLNYQFYKGICEEAGYKGPLSQCDFYGNKEAGKKLKKLYATGASKPYKQVIGQVAKNGQKLDGNPLNEYFQPIEKWIDEKNLPKVGWKKDL